MKKILHLQILPLMSGAQKFSSNLSKALEGEGTEHHVVFSKINSDSPSSCLKAESFSNFKFHLSSYLRREASLIDIFHLFWLIYIVFKVRPDVIVAVSSKNVVFGALCKLFYRRATYLRVVQGIPYRLNSKGFANCIIFRIDLWFSSFFDSIWVVNTTYQRIYEKVNPRVHYVPNSSHFPDSRPSDSKDTVPIRLLFVGRLDFQKNVHFLLDVMADLVKIFGSGIKLEIVGDGPDNRSLRDKVKELNLSKNIAFLGWQNDPDKFYSKADIFVMFSRYEGFGYVLLEAAKHGLPCVCCGVEGILDVVTHQKGGYLIEQEDKDSAVKYVSLLVNDCKKRNEMGSYHFSHCAEKFSNDLIFEQYRIIFNNLLDNKSIG